MLRGLWGLRCVTQLRLRGLPSRVSAELATLSTGEEKSSGERKKGFCSFFWVFVLSFELEFYTNPPGSCQGASPWTELLGLPRCSRCPREGTVTPPHQNKAARDQDPNSGAGSIPEPGLDVTGQVSVVVGTGFDLIPALVAWTWLSHHTELHTL